MSIDQPFSFNRIYKGPPAEGQVFTSSVDLNNYLTSPVRYAGQKVSLVEGGEVTEYVLNATEDAWIEGGGAKQAAKGAISTGLLMGGTLGVASSTEFTVADGKGFIVDTYADPDNPVITEVEWTSLGNITDTEIANGELTFIAIDATGSVVQSSTEFSRAQLKTLIYLGYTVHADLINITGVTDIAIPVTNPANLTYDLARSVGPFKIDPITLRGSVTDLSITSDAGDIFKYGANFKIDPKDASAFSVAALDSSVPSTAIQVYKDGVGGFTFNPITQIDPSVYDDGTGTPAVVRANNWSVKTVYLAPNIGKLYVALGTVEYSTLNQAIERFSAEQLSLPDTAEQTLLLGWIFAKGNAVDFNSPDVTTKILQSDKFGNTTGGGATSVVSNVTVTAENNLEIEDSEGTNIYRADDTYWFIEDFKENDELVITSASGNLPITMDLATPLQGRRSGIATLGVSIAPGDDFGIDNITVPTYSDVTKMEVLVEITGNAVFDSVLYDGVTEVARKQVTNGKFSHIFNSSFTTLNQRFEYVGGGAPGDTIKFDRIRFTDDAFDTGETVVTEKFRARGFTFSGNVAYYTTIEEDTTGSLVSVSTTAADTIITALRDNVKLSGFAEAFSVGGGSNLSFVKNYTGAATNPSTIPTFNVSYVNGANNTMNPQLDLTLNKDETIRLFQTSSSATYSANSNFAFTATAKADNVVIEGTALPDTSVTKILSANTSATGVISGLSFIDLKIGKRYILEGVIGSDTTNNTYTATILHNGKILTYVGVSASTGTTPSVGANVGSTVYVEFTAESTTLDYNVISAGNVTTGNGTKGPFGSYLTLKEDNRTTIVQIPQNKGLNSIGLAGNNSQGVTANVTDIPFNGIGNGWNGSQYEVQYSDSIVNIKSSILFSGDAVNRIILYKNGVYYKIIGVPNPSNVNFTVGDYTSKKGEFLEGDLLSIRSDRTGNLSNSTALHYLNITEQRPQINFIGEASPERYSTAEIDTGKFWIDGKPIYSVSNELSSAVSSTTNIQNIGIGRTPINGVKINATTWEFPQWSRYETNASYILLRYDSSTGELFYLVLGGLSLDVGSPYHVEYTK